MTGAIVATCWGTGPFPVLRNGDVSFLEHANNGEALEIGDGGGQQSLQPSFAPAPVTGFAYTEVLEMVDLAFHFGPPP